MSLWSALAKIGGVALAPFTGGASIPIGMGVGGALDSLGNAGQVAGNDAAAAAEGRYRQGQLQQGQDRNAIELYRQKLLDALTTPGKLASNAVRGDLMAHAQPASFSGLPSYIHVPQMTGGLSPAAFGPGTRQAGAQLTRTALQNLMSNQFNLPRAPELTPLPQASGYDTFSKILGRVGSYAGALGHGNGDWSPQGGTATGYFNPDDYQGIDPGTGMPFESGGDWGDS